jgi:hypothetical protein
MPTLKAKIGGKWVPIGGGGTISQEDIDGILKNAQDYADQLWDELDDELYKLQNDLGETNEYINGAFKDGVISETEARKIQTYLNTLATDKVQFDEEYSHIYNNAKLSDGLKGNLATAKSNYDDKYTALITAINTAIADFLATVEEANAVNTAFADYNDTISVLVAVLRLATEDIGQKMADEANEGAKSYADGLFGPIQNQITEMSTSITQNQREIELKATMTEVTTKIEEANTQVTADAKAYADGLKDELAEDISGLSSTVGDMDAYIDGAFKDGVISSSEAFRIQGYINTIASSKNQLDKEYQELYANVYLTGTPKTNLNSAKTGFDTAYTNLINSINVAITDSTATAEESADVDAKFALYNDSVTILTARLTQATDSIALAKSKEAGDGAKAYADAIKAELDADIQQVYIDMGATEGNAGEAFKDGIVSEAEASRIKGDLNNIATSKTRLDEEYNELYANPYLTGTVKTELYNAKSAFNTAHTDLIDTINSVISDSKATDEERTLVTSKFQAYNTTLGAFAQKVAQATDYIAQAKADEAEQNAKDYTDGIVEPMQNTITQHTADIKLNADNILLRVTEEKHSLDLATTLQTANKYVDDTKILIDGDIEAVSGDVTTLSQYVDGSFKDGIVYESEAKKIQSYIQNLDLSKKQFDSRYTEIYNNADLTGQTKTDLATAKTDYNTKYTALINSINTAIADGKSTQAEADDVNAKFSAYNGTVSLLATLLDKAVDIIGKAKADKALADGKAYSDTLKQGLDGDIQAVAQDVGDLDTYIDGSFKDGVISEAEAKKIQAILKGITDSRTVLHNRYVQIYANTYLTGTPKTDLSQKKGDYDTAYNNLVTSINTAIADGKTTSTESADVDTKFTLYNNKAEALTLSLEKAIDAIAKAKADEALNGANGYTDGIAEGLDSRIETAEASIKTNADNIQLAVTKEAYAASVIGVRNILTRTAFRENPVGSGTFEHNLSGSIGTNAVTTIAVVDETTAPKGKAMTITRTDSATNSGGRYWTVPAKLKVGFKYSWGIWVKGTGTWKIGSEQGGQKDVILTSVWQYVTLTFTATDTTGIQFTMYRVTGQTGGAITFHSLILTEGDKVGTWVPALEDTDTRIASAEALIKVNADNILLRVEKNGVIGAINATSEELLVDFEKINFKGKVTYEAFAPDAKGKLDAGVTAKSDIDGLVISGINLLDDTIFTDASKYGIWGVGTLTAVTTDTWAGFNYLKNETKDANGTNLTVAANTAFGIQSPRSKFAVKAGKKYTVSMIVATSETGKLLNYLYLMHSDGNGHTALPTIDISTFPVYNSAFSGASALYNYHQVYFTFTADRDDPNAYILIGARTARALDPATGYAWIRVAKLKVEEGTKPTAWNESPNDTQKKIDTVATSVVNGNIYVKGTGANRGGNRILKVNNTEIYNTTGRGLRITTLNRTTLAVVFDQLYDVYTTGTPQDDFVAKLNSLDDSVIVVISSYDAIKTNTTAMFNALTRVGGSGKYVTYRNPFALIGIPGIGRGAGLEVITNGNATDPNAEISVKVIDGIPQGINTGSATMAQEVKDTVDTNINVWNLASNFRTDGQLDPTKIFGTVPDSKVAGATNWNYAKSAVDLWQWQGDKTIINGAVIGTNTIFAKSMLMADFTNLCENPNFELDAVGSTPAGFGSTVSYRRVADISGFANGNGSSKAWEFDARNGSNNSAYGDNLIPVTPGQKFFYEAEGRYLNTAGTGTARIGFRRYDAKRQALDAWDGVIYWNESTKVTAFTKKSGTYTVPAGCYFLQVYVSFADNGETTNKFYIDNIRLHRMSGAELIVNGSITGDHVQTGSLSFDKSKGGTLALGGPDNGNGKLEVYNTNGDLIADLDADRGGFSDLTVANLDAPNVLSYGSDSITYYVSDRLINYEGSIDPDDSNDGLGWTRPLMSVNEALRRIPKYNDGTVTIMIAYNSVLYEDISVTGFVGTGTINIVTSGGGVQVNGNLKVMANTNRIFFGTSDYTITWNGRAGSYAVCDMGQSVYTRFENVKVFGSGSDMNFQTTQGYTELVNCQTWTCKYGVSAKYGGTVYVSNVTGSVTDIALHAYGGTIVGGGNAPSAPQTVAEVAGGRIGGRSSAGSGFTFPTQTAPTAPSTPDKTTTWSSTGGNSWRDNYGGEWYNQGIVAQGSWGGYGVYRGLWFFGTTPASTLNGKTIKSMRLYIKRTGSGGYSSSVNVAIRAHNYSSQPTGVPSLGGVVKTASFKWNEGKWVSIPSSMWGGFMNNTFKGFGIYVGGGGNGDYARFGTSAKLEVTYA